MKPKIYMGTYTTEDLAGERRRLEEVITNYRPQEPPCQYNLSTGRVNCLDTCVSHVIEYEECPEKKYHKALRELSRLDARSLLTLFFSDADLAALNGFLNREGLVYSHLDVLRRFDEWHCPELGELRFHGVRIQEDWEFSLRNIVLPFVVSLLFVLVVVAKLTFGDWATAWNVGCFFVALATLLWMWAEYSVRQSA
ncbi:hypothetical protein Asppvi_005566 [Aspergillus pseudoviridinutans]|uniref:Uncharacterized protein n=1 Tax=Aspergillus pseudoviridinutans TaxID=1517512 RepID=A0A9P3BB40_9EURO|nr:uncharacterized protein Asppvi_005566 [Aspergillus pseudoviridinutans]GIJ86674.1 hypothetical protein Asppvi_005566 [Aspergillus pseudoviridinutans]